MSEFDSSRALELLKRILVESSEGACGRLAVVQGGLTRGKTTLLHEIAQCATDTGALLLGATGSRTERGLQAGLIDQLFQSQGLPAGSIDRVRAMITSAMLVEQDDGEPPLHTVLRPSALLVHETCRAMLELSRTRPLVVVVDDVQFADDVSLQLLLYLLRRMRSARIVMVLSEWDWPQPALSPLRAELTGRPHHLIRLGPLSGEATSRMVRQALDRRVGSGLATAFHDLTGGNPLLLTALLEDHRNAEDEERDGRDGTGDEEGATLAYEVALRLEAAGTGPVELFASGRRAPSRHRDGRVHLGDDDSLIDTIRQLSGTDPRALEDEELLRMVLPAIRSDYKAAETYRHRPGPPLSCPITVLTGDHDPEVTRDEAAAWSDHTTDRFSLHEFPGGHFYLNAHAATVVSLIRTHLTRR